MCDSDVQKGILLTPLIMFGGAFDPFHLGHLSIVDYIKQHKPNHQLLLVPSAWSAGKPKPLFSDEHRMEILNNLFADDDDVQICDIEIKQNKTTFTIDTIHTIKETMSFDRLTLAIGADQCMKFHQWKQYELILSEANMLVFLRDGMTKHDVDTYIDQTLPKARHKIEVLDVMPPKVSSTDIRQKMAKGLPIDDLVPSDVNSAINLLKKRYGGMVA